MKNKIDKSKIHSEFIARYTASFAAEQDERDNCLEDMRFCFVPGSQWDDASTQQRRDRPRFAINKVVGPVNTAIGEQRQNRISIKVRAGDDGASKDVADTLGGLVRNIEQQSHFKDVKDTAYKDLCAGGFGAWYITTEYENENSFDQNVKIKAIKSAASSVFYDTAATDELKRDAKWIVVTQDVDKADFRAKYPDASTGELPKSGSLSGWQSRDTIRVADYWVKEPYMVETALMSDGTIITLDKESTTVIDDLAMQGITITKTKKSIAQKIVMYKMTAGEIVEGPFEWAGNHIPVVPIFGYNTWIDGNHFYCGMVRHAKDPQRVYNYATSQAIEISALSPKDPIWLTATQAQGHEKQLKSFNTTNKPFMFYNADPDAPGAPQRTGAPSVQAALLQQVQQADADIQSTTGFYAPALGDNQNDQSGRAILALQRKSNLSTFELLDNLNKAVEWTGQIIVDLIPAIYDTARTISILGESGAQSTAKLNTMVVDEATGQQVMVNDLRKGSYKVESTVGPTFATQRAEGLNFLTKLSDSNPLFSSVSADLMAQSIDFPYAEELTARVRKQLIKEGIVEPNEDEMQAMQGQEQQGPSPLEQLAFEERKLQVEQLAALVDNLELQNLKLGADTTHKFVETQETLTDILETKADINKKLTDMGIEANLPIEADEIAARRGNLKAINSSLVMTAEDMYQLQLDDEEQERGMDAMSGGGQLPSEPIDPTMQPIPTLE